MAGGIKENSEDDMDVAHEINVTPFIDVMLVLLIIFMVAAPLATVDVNVDLPVSNATPAPRPEAPLFVSLKDDLSLLVGVNPVTAEGLAAALDEHTGGDREARVFLRADQAVAYGDVMTTMNNLRAAGYVRVALVGLESANSVAIPAPEAQ
ncbi:TonB system transport protein ExbD [Ketogulonicigenium vulgare]|uniref:Biopolymer transport protein ExbD n=1 Tax=Ketogulonicigenium vulgare (strain WSH-001) TaxID=759362 RepID=F9Y425_KETVW|nr:TonB system transport protein ExbD [Ketogulonicigenium vulgare]ADO43432.1 exbD, uptake of enterochelin; tonB-dependent uptake of B colicins [Ketogulonicigenium vulgare Y25]AEM41716.1 Biopolymer transport protein [Ketogulonicigenium vulgare WSH-001]ALJ81825.1 biopolymer transporter ExbD [Ketogulonicigenium vulgare]ANW34480.1 TonB system transport protein ExbD [Ketogulonicigenium vulgare]AOZ55469.1 exbD, uptake of enterochelin; tonB-dependent uptake of B colicins [Ketogulonicigenium vulgare]